MVNFHGLFFFSDGEITERRPWVITKKHGALPNAQEWVRLQQEYGLTPVNLNENEEKKARLIAEVISQDPMKWLSKEEVGAYIKWRSSENNRARKKYA